MEMKELLQQNAKPVVVPAVAHPDPALEPLMTAPGGDDTPCNSVLEKFGWWQVRTLLVVGLVKVPSAWHMASILFTAPTPAPHQFWCARPPALQHLDGRVWRNISHVRNEGKLDSCNVYREVYEMAIHHSDWSTINIPDNATTQLCEQFEYNSSITFVTEWDLVCSREVLVSVSQFFYLLGILLGGVACTKLLQKSSPRSLILGGMILQIIAGLGVANSPNFELQVFLRFVTAFSCATMFTAGYVICTDNTGDTYCQIVGAAYEFFWSAGVILLAVISYLVDNWRELQYAITLPTAAILILYRWIPNSPRWLLNNGEMEAARELLERALMVNGDPNPKVPILSPPIACSRMEGSRTSWRVLISLHVAWATTVVTYYGALLNIKNVGEELHVNTAIAGSAEVAGVLVGIVLLLRIKHKWRALGCINIIGGGACFLSWTLPLEGNDTWGFSLLLLLAMMGRIAIGTSLTLLTVSSAEVIPAGRKKSWMFSAVTIARVCLLSAPFIGSLAMFGPCVSLSVFGGLTVIGGVAAFFLDSPTILDGELPK
ncbi:organic cation transporter protein isoform X2 [Anabrus simplex]|uniref:organic cation transporter protein isoform X2 n=1 Tax=Anabrus simplex TaxID=316456 RepID=UPI0035A2CE83